MSFNAVDGELVRAMPPMDPELAFMLEGVNVSANVIPLLRANQVCTPSDFATLDPDARTVKCMLSEIFDITDDSDIGSRLQLSRVMGV